MNLRAWEALDNCLPRIWCISASTQLRACRTISGWVNQRFLSLLENVSRDTRLRVPGPVADAQLLQGSQRSCGEADDCNDAKTFGACVKGLQLWAQPLSKRDQISISEGRWQHKRGIKASVQPSVDSNSKFLIGRTELLTTDRPAGPSGKPSSGSPWAPFFSPH